MTGYKKPRATSQPIRSKTKTSCDLLARVLPRLAPAASTVFASSCDSFIGLSASSVTGQRHYFGFGFTSLN